VRDTRVLLQLQRAVPLREMPLLVQINLPGDVFERQIEFRAEQRQVEF